MELLSPAGNEEKLAYAYLYGADAAYIGLGGFSLRARADNFAFDESVEKESAEKKVPEPEAAEPEQRGLADRLKALKGEKKLYGAFNIFFHNSHAAAIEEEMETLKTLPLDGCIVSDIGAFSLLRRHMPKIRFHLSTQANCLNSEAVKAYRDLGFSRIILGRELTLGEIEKIRGDVPDIELEAFVHGAMCLAYSGRCYLSSYLTGRSANTGDCTHSCRWNYRVLEEKERPGEFFPVEENDGFTTILSSKDLNMFDHVGDLKNAGIDSIKIEGRMKSLYYTAVVTRAYRRAVDFAEPEACREAGREVPGEEELSLHREELENVSHREYSTGFYFGRRDADETTEGSYRRRYEFLGTIGEKRKHPGETTDNSSGLLHNSQLYRLEVRNSIGSGEALEFIGPDSTAVEDKDFRLYGGDGTEIEKANRGPHNSFIGPSVPVKTGYIIRRKRETETP
ncbi:MAG: U32 family peptidase C-terminal domain-containing protein [Spirochaetia bacterium]